MTNKTPPIIKEFEKELRLAIDWCIMMLPRTKKNGKEWQTDELRDEIVKCVSKRFLLKALATQAEDLEIEHLKELKIQREEWLKEIEEGLPKEKKTKTFEDHLVTPAGYNQYRQEVKIFLRNYGK